MKVIVAGMSKTGTKTMNAALTLLGYEVYDCLDNLWYFGDDWLNILTKGAKIADLQRMYKDVDAVCDIPCCFYWEELLEAFPDVKIILTTRDERSWYLSLKEQRKSMDTDLGIRLLKGATFTGRRLLPAYNAFTALVGYRGKWPWSNMNLYDEEVAKRMFHKHNRAVLQNAPKDQLLVYEVKQGWKPLCDFLGVEIPDLEFPHKNKGASLAAELRKENKIMRRMERELFVSLGICSILFVYFAYNIPIRRLIIAAFSKIKI